LETDLKDSKRDIEKISDEFNRLDKAHKILCNERDKMKQRLIKLKNKRQRVDVNQKICKNCGKEYLESENFNWSCRTHHVNNFAKFAE
jgi:chromosome segregation ATPase